MKEEVKLLYIFGNLISWEIFGGLLGVFLSLFRVVLYSLKLQNWSLSRELYQEWHQCQFNQEHASGMGVLPFRCQNTGVWGHLRCPGDPTWPLSADSKGHKFPKGPLPSLQRCPGYPKAFPVAQRCSYS